MQHRIVICTGGALGAWALDYLQPHDLLIGADRGASFLVSHGFKPEISIGDFDSVSRHELESVYSNSRKVIACDPVDKDFTDTEMAFRLALDMQPKEIVMLGALGTRFDHSLANVQLLSLAAERGIHACIADEHNWIRVITSAAAAITIERGGFPNVSLLPLSERVAGITLTGFQYPLHEAALAIGQSLGISNALTADTGTVQIKDGRLLIIQSRD